MAKTKLRAEAYGSLEEFRADVNLTAEKILEIRKLELARDKAVQKILEERNPEIQALTEEAKAILSRADVYAKQHRDEVFPAGAKTSETELCTYFLRLGNPTLTALNSKWNEKAQVDACKADPCWQQFVRVKESLDKDAIKAAGFSDSELAFKGLRISQSERLTVEPKVSNL